MAESAPGTTEIAVVELFNPAYDAATHTATYEAKVLADYEATTELGFHRQPGDLAQLAPRFGAAHLFIDDCPDVSGCLRQEVGGPAINPVPRQMIRDNVGAVVDLAVRGVDVTISVPDGELRARKTTNARLGILGGISILGTTGVVRPFSTESWRASVVQAVSVMAAQDEPTLVLATGGRTEKAAMRMLPDLPEVCFVEVGDFTGAALRQAVDDGLRDVVFVGMAGKLTKLASGVLMTHYTKSRVDTAVLADITRELAAEPALVDAVASANTARHAYELWEAAGVLRPAGDRLCERVAEVLTRFGGLPARVALVDPTGAGVVAATEPDWVRP